MSQTSAQPEASRICPHCGEMTLHEQCPRDAMATVQLRSAELPWRNGTLIDHRYRIEKQLGRGGYGAVFAALDERRGERVALKILTPTERPEDARRFHREADVLARLRSPHTVRVLGRGPTGDGSLYLAMELLEGRSLYQWLHERADAGRVLTAHEATLVGVHVLRSLEEAHAQGLVHRDLKPSNVMVCEMAGQVVVRLVDFGIAHVPSQTVKDADDATLPDPMTVSGRVMGTPTFMSPEQCLGTPLDGRSDLYALGVLLYRCVSGELPFDDPNPLTTMYNHVHAPVRDLLTVARTPISVAFSEEVHRALAKAPGQRRADARAMRLALEACAEGPGQRPIATTTADFEPVEFVEQQTVPQEQRPQRRWQWPVAMAATLALATAGTLTRAPRLPPPTAPLAARPAVESSASLTAAAEPMNPAPPATAAPPAALAQPSPAVAAPAARPARLAAQSSAPARSATHPHPVRPRREAASVLPPD